MSFLQIKNCLKIPIIEYSVKKKKNYETFSLIIVIKNMVPKGFLFRVKKINESIIFISFLFIVRHNQTCLSYNRQFITSSLPRLLLIRESIHRHIYNG